MSNNNFADFLKKARKKAGLTQKDIYSQLNIPQSTYSSWEVGKSSPDINNIKKICRIIGISINELLDWEKERLFDHNEEKLVEVFRLLDNHGKKTVLAIIQLEHERMFNPEPDYRNNKRIIKVYSQNASAGLGSYLFEDDNYDLVEFDEETVPAKTSFGIRIKGDSMEPKIKDGHIVFVEALPKLEEGDVGIFIYDKEAYCKKLKIDYAKEMIYLLSLNQAYTPIEIRHTDLLKTVGKVVGSTEEYGGTLIEKQTFA